MVGPFYPFESTDNNYQTGLKEGFDIAESYLKKITKKFYKEMKKGLLKRMATCSTVSNHKCNCEYCGLDEKDIKL